MKGLLCGLWCAALLTTGALASELPSYLPDSLGEDEYVVGPDGEAVAYGNDRATAGTDFYLYIEAAPDKPYDDGPVHRTDDALPKTGDAGISLETVLIAALMCGMGYLACSGYAEKARS